MNKKILRLLSVILVLVYCINLQILNIFAEESADSNMTIKISSVEAKAGEDVEVKIDLSNNPGLSSLKFKVKYAKELTLKSVVFDEKYGSYVTAPEPYSNPQTLSMISPLKEVSYNGTFATLEFHVSESAKNDFVSKITITYDEDDIFDGNYDNIPVSIIEGTVKISNTNEESEKMTIQIPSLEAKAGEDVEVAMTLKNNPGISSLKFKVDYNEMLTLKEVKFNDALGSYVTAPEPYGSPQTISMISPLSEITFNGTFVTLVFHVSESAKDGFVSNITATYDEDDIFDGNYDNIPVSIIEGTVKISNTNEESEKMTIQIPSIEAKAGEDVEVAMTLKNNPGISSLKFKVDYNEMLTLKEVKFNDALGSYVTAPEPYGRPQTISMISPLSEVTFNGTFVTLVFHVSDKAETGSSFDFGISYDEDDIFDSDYNNVKTEIINGKVTIIAGQIVFEPKNEMITLDDDFKVVYGLEEGITDLEDFVAYDNCELVYHETEAGFGTGTTVDVVSNGTVVDTYTIVIFGDVTGDGYVDSFDMAMITSVVNWEYEFEEDSVYSLAADVSGDEVVDETDMVLIDLAANFLSEISQTK